MPYTYTIMTTIPASAQEIYDAWLDSLAHFEMTEGKATMSEEIRAEISAWDGHITGRNLELLPSERIVQSWRTPEFSDQHEDSVITLTLEEIDGGTLLTLVHSNVPEEHTGYEQSGWQELLLPTDERVLCEPRADQCHRHVERGGTQDQAQAGGNDRQIKTCCTEGETEG